MENPDPLLKRAMELHRTRQSAAADALYAKVLSRDPSNPNVLGLRAMVALARGQRRKAIGLLQKGLDSPAEPIVFRRNLYNLASALYEENMISEAKIVLRRPIPGWPADAVPDRQNLDVIIALVRLLAIFNHPGRALELAESVKAHIDKNSGALEIIGALYLTAERFEEAYAALDRADQIGPARASLKLALASAAAATKNVARAAQETARYVQLAPMLLTPANKGQKALIAVTNWLPSIVQRFSAAEPLHFNGNFLTQLHARYADRFRFLSVFVESPQALAAVAKSPTPDVVFNKAVNAEQLLMRAGINELSAMTDIWDRPTINHPKNVALVTRDASETLYHGLSSVIIPKVRRYRKAGPAAGLAEAILSEFDLPVIVRGLVEQEGANAFKVDDRAGLEKAIADVWADPFFYVIAFRENRTERGFYRKLRAAVVDDVIQIVRVDSDTSWNVHGRKSVERARFYLDNPTLLDEERAICRNADAFFGPQVMETLRAMRQRVPLEIFGIDFDVTRDNEVIFFEANAAMNLLSSAMPGLDHPMEAEDVFFAAFETFIERLKGTGAALAKL